MTVVAQELVLATFLVFCRIGGCLMMMPVFSSPRVNVQSRLFVTIGITLAVTPLLMDTVRPLVTDISTSRLLTAISTEVLAGTMIGVMGRCFFLALQFMGVAVATFIGIGNMPGAPVEGTDPVPVVADMITLTATVLFVVTNLHLEVIRVLIESYQVLPVTAPYQGITNVTGLVTAMADSFRLSLQITSPFIIYAIVVNLTFGIVNKLIPQIPIYFISLPFVVAGGIYLLFLTFGELLQLFISGFGSWLANL